MIAGILLGFVIVNVTYILCGLVREYIKDKKVKREIEELRNQ